MGPAPGEHGQVPVSDVSGGMPGGVALSATLHLFLVGVFVFGLPTLFHPPPPKDVPIAVRLVTIAPETRATHPNRHIPRRDAKPVEASGDVPAAKPKPKPEPRKPAPPPSAAQKPAPLPKHAETEPPPAARPSPKPAPPKPEKASVPKPQEKPQPTLAQAEKPPRRKNKEKQSPRSAKSEHRLAAKKKNPEAKYDAAKFAALLRNLAPERNAPSPDAPPQEAEATDAQASSQPIAPLGGRLTMSEMDLVKRQIEQCWNIPAGARDAKNLTVEIKVSLAPDGNVENAEILDRSRLATDNVFRAAAESARRAFYNPRCQPLHLPPDKYSLWKELIVDFSPKDLL